MLITIIVFLVVLSVLVLVHEFGHFMMARRFGVGAEEFGLGFPPRLAGFYKTKEGKWRWVWGKREVTDARDTVYSLNWIPLGGFVRITGEDGGSADDPKNFAKRPIWQRAWILSAGVLMNVILAAVLLSAALMIGTPQPLDGTTQPAGAIVGQPRTLILEVFPDTAASRAGLKPGDEIISINNQSFESIDALRAYVGNKAGQTMRYEISHGSTTETKEIIPAQAAGEDRATIGVSLSQVVSVRYPWYQAIYQGIKLTGTYILATILGFVHLIVQLVSGHGVSADVAGPVGIAAMTGQVLDIGFSYLLLFAATLSISLAVINFLPFPALDGGRVLFLIIEKIKGRPVKASTEAIIHNIGFLLLIGLIILVTFRDVRRLLM